MTLSDDLKDYVTYTPRDSLVLYGDSQTSGNTGITHLVASRENLNPILSGLNSQQYKALAEGRAPAEYIEWQAHTPVLFKDVEKITVDKADMKMKKSIEKFSKKHSIMRH
ncbi:hypothetical protein [Escherichia sp. E1130]|nr:hypothetical protein [Escherichia sp. E1130]TGC20878.1 hypothetical protein CQJ27_25910 [Escherichia sp. E1130]